jgi:lipid A 3-O-deacylase
MTTCLYKSHRFLALCVAAAAGFVALSMNAAHAADGWRTTFLEENDSLYFNSDKHYTQGLRLSALSPVIDQNWANGIFDFVGLIPTVFGPGGERRVAFLAGQSIFTPKNLDIKPPDPTDRPYAGWLYGGISLLQETGGTALENLEIDLGVVGPGALGKQAQNDFHQFIDIHQAQGWSNQLQHEVGGVVSYERLWHVPVPFLSVVDDGVVNGIDIVPQVGGSGGNVFTYGAAGGLLRVGRHLEADYGPVRVRPALSGTDYFNPKYLDDEVGFYFFAGVQGRAVARNIFLDGNDFRQSASVQHKTFVADFEGGASIFWSSRIRLDVSAVRRTREFVGQHHPDVIGTAALAFTW